MRCIPVTTTSCNTSVSDSMRTVILCFAFTSTVFIPTEEIRNSVPSSTFKVNLPSKSVTVPLSVVPFTKTEAPITGSLLSASTTIPSIPESWAIAKPIPISK